MALLLAANDPERDDHLRRIFSSAHIAVAASGPILVVPDIRHQRDAIGVLLAEQLSPADQHSIHAVYAHGAIDTAAQVLSAFVGKLPLAQLLAQTDHEWVRDVLVDDTLFSVFHPIIDAWTGHVFAQEALLRATASDTGRIIGAGPIIEACAALNLQHQLDQRARRTAIRNGAAHVDATQKLFINFLPNTIYDPELCLRTTVEAASAYGVPLSRLVFEVVETEQIPDMQRLQTILEYYRARGVGTAVDDMGAGFTTLNYITRLHPDYVKVDREIVVAAAGGDRSTHAHLARIVETAHAVGSRVIAEGIETELQQEVCLGVDVDYVQGFRYARPAFPPPMVEVAVPPRRRPLRT